MKRFIWRRTRDYTLTSSIDGSQGKVVSKVAVVEEENGDILFTEEYSSSFGGGRHAISLSRGEFNEILAAI